MDIDNTYVKFKHKVNGVELYVYCSVWDIITVGNPKNELGVDLDVASDRLHQWKDIGRGYQYVAIN